MANAMYFPPYIEGKISSQYGLTLEIPFELNRAIDINQIGSVHARIKNVVSNTLIATLETKDFRSEQQKNIYIAKFDISQKDNPDISILDLKTVNKWQYYKIQLAFDSSSAAYSPVGIFKYTLEPTIGVFGLQNNNVNYVGEKFIGTYESSDYTEKVFQYKFDLYQNGQLKETSGWVYHNAATDADSTHSQDEFTFKELLENNKTYQLIYSVKTNNYLIASSPVYFIKPILKKRFDIDVDLIATNNKDDGTIEVRLLNKKEIPVDISGQYYLYYQRDDMGTWEKIEDLTLDFTLFAKEEKIIYKDKVSQQGVAYKYGLSGYYNDITTELKETESIICDFEDAFLFDGIKMLRIKFNPKVSSFKNTLLESKLETIGGKYPFIFRNGRTCYKEFSISGLISYLMDDSFAFQDCVFEPTTDLTGENIAKEREFKLQVLEWLTNGEPKLFKSPTEGNYIVRLLNTSLSPNDTLGRMLHTFSSTAYEIAEFNYDNLISYGFINRSQDIVEHVKTEEKVLKNYQEIVELADGEIIELNIKDSSEGDIFHLKYHSGYNISITIGINGSYRITTTEEDPIISVKPNTPYQKGTIIYKYLKRHNYPFFAPNNKDLYLSKIYSNEVLEQFAVVENNTELLFGSLEDENYKNGIDLDGSALYIKDHYKELQYCRARCKDMVFINEDNYYGEFELKKHSIWLVPDKFVFKEVLYVNDMGSNNLITENTLTEDWTEDYVFIWDDNKRYFLIDPNDFKVNKKTNFLTEQDFKFTVCYNDGTEKVYTLFDCLNNNIIFSNEQSSIYSNSFELENVEKIKGITNIGKGVVLDLFYSFVQYHYKKS